MDKWHIIVVKKHKNRIYFTFFLFFTIIFANS